MSKKSSTQRRELYHFAEKYIDIKTLFPRSKVVHKTPSDYQRRKIKQAMDAIVADAGGLSHLVRDFIPMPRTKALKEFNKKSGAPVYQRGVMIAGGRAINQNVSIANGALSYTRGDSQRKIYALDAATAESLAANIRAHKRSINSVSHIPYITTNGQSIAGLSVSATAQKGEPISATDLLIKVATALHVKYSRMAEVGEKRDNGKMAAHPTKWGMGLMLDRAATQQEKKNAAAMIAAEKWTQGKTKAKK